MKEEKMLEKWSKRAERIRETWVNRYLAERVSYAIWLVVEILARIVGDKRRVADAVGQRALFWREVGRLQKSLELIEHCYGLACGLDDSGLMQVYIGERAWVLSLMDKHELAISNGNLAADMARDFSPQHLCRRLRKLGQILIRAGKIEEARAPLEEAAKIALDESHPVAHPVHRVEALVDLARYILLDHGGDSKMGWEYLSKANRLAQKYFLWRQFERIEELKIVLLGGRLV